MAFVELKPFQEEAHDGLLARFLEAKRQYDYLGATPKAADVDVIRKCTGARLLQAPTGSGKTLIATRVVASLSENDRILWFWFAPFSGVIEQTIKTLQAQTPTLPILELTRDRRVEALRPGGVFVTTWQSVATSNKEGRKARVSGDMGLAVDDLIAAAREIGYRIGCVVDEAHHGFKKAAEAKRFFVEVLRPEYTLLMTATPKDHDAKAFARETGYQVGDETDWASISRYDGVRYGLLKKGVKMARFIVKNPDDSPLIDFERTALRECGSMHGRIKETLKQEGLNVTPLMLIQVPNGGKSIEKAKEFLIESLGFEEGAVAVHTADEPDPDLLALVDDPKVEVLLFKMAVALGFDAPRAWTLAALRGARDASFGVQVVGRLMRKHRLLQGLRDLPAELDYGYVFLANSEAQEGLLNAGDLINQMPSHVSELGSQTVVTIMAGEPGVQVVKNGESLRLFPESVDSDSLASAREEIAAPAGAVQGELLAQDWKALVSPIDSGIQRGQAAAVSSSLTLALASDAGRSYSYNLKADAPKVLLTEKMPDVADDFEEQLASHIDFSSVLVDRDRKRAKIVQRTQELFEPQEVIDEEKWASLSPEAIAERATQLVFAFEDVDRYKFPRLLAARYRESLINNGIEPPVDEEELLQQLDLILVRNQRLIQNAHKRCRAGQLKLEEVLLEPVLTSELRLDVAKRNIYGVFPGDLNLDERRFSEMLDIDDNVLWWHRNPSRQPSSVGLYGWSEGTGFFPDFVVAVKDRKVGNGIALVEVKGPHLQNYEKAKASARHKEYNQAFMVGYNKGEKEFMLYREEGGNLYENGRFEVNRLRWEG